MGAGAMKNSFKAVLQTPPRRFAQITIGCSVIIVTLSVGLVAHQFRALKAIQAEKAHSDGLAQTRQTMLATEAQLQQGIDRITATSLGPGLASSLEQASIDNVRRLDGLAAQHRVALIGVTPSGLRDVMSLEEMPVDLEVKGQYRDLATMLVAMPAALPNATITQLSASRGKASGNVIMKLRIARYRFKEKKGK